MHIPHESTAPPTAPEPDDGRAAGGRAAADAAMVVLAVLAFGAAFTWLGPVLKPFLLAVFLFYVTRFGAKTLSTIGLGPRAAYSSLLLIAVVLAVLFGQLVYREAAIFLGKWPKYEARITRFIDSLPQLDLLPSRSPAAETGPATGGLGEFFGQLSRESLDYVFRHSLDVAEIFVLVLVYLIFLFVGSRKLPDRIRRAFPDERADRLLRIGDGISQSMERFMAVKTVVGLGMGATAGLLMYLFGLDHWLLWAFLFFASNYITYIGSIVACVPPIVLAFLDLSGLPAAISLAVLLVLNRLLWIDFVEIRMSGRQLNLDPTLMFLWLSYWGWVWGVLGLLLAYPMLAAVKIALLHAKGSEGWAVMLSDD
jgi:AI-2 transport protein TqsA